jgi:aldose 1-epimerase
MMKGEIMHIRSNIAYRLTIIAVILSFSSAGLSQNPTVTSSLFGTTTGGTDVMLYTLTNSNGLQAKVIEYGGTVISLQVPDRDGTLANIVRGYDNINSYVQNAWTGAIIGRYANRIGNARFTLDGVEYILTANSGAHQLHGGSTYGFHNVVWKGYPYKNSDEAGVILTHMSLDGQEGYPGNLTCTVKYALTDSNELRIEYSATTDKPTVVNFTNHSYFNLAGIGNGDILDHQVMINASFYTYTGTDNVPTGEIRPLGTGMDFKTPKAIRSQIASVNRTGQYDHNFILNFIPGELILAATAYDPKTGRMMECYTDQPGMQFYNASDRSTFCFETQHFPDSPNKPHFPSTVLRPGEKFESTTIYKFSAE